MGRKICLNSYNLLIKLMGEEFLIHEQGKWFLQRGSVSGEDDVHSFLEVIRKDLELTHNRAVAHWSIDTNLEDVLQVKYCQTASRSASKSCERKSQLLWQTS